MKLENLCATKTDAKPPSCAKPYSFVGFSPGGCSSFSIYDTCVHGFKGNFSSLRGNMSFVNSFVGLVTGRFPLLSLLFFHYFFRV